jgi:hypothetical protein
MRYEINIQVELDPEADFAGTDDEIENVYLLIESAIKSIDELHVERMEVREDV